MEKRQNHLFQTVQTIICDIFQGKGKRQKHLLKPFKTSAFPPQAAVIAYLVAEWVVCY